MQLEESWKIICMTNFPYYIFQSDNDWLNAQRSRPTRCRGPFECLASTLEVYPKSYAVDRPIPQLCQLSIYYLGREMGSIRNEYYHCSGLVVGFPTLPSPALEVWYKMNWTLWVVPH